MRPGHRGQRHQEEKPYRPLHPPTGRELSLPALTDGVYFCLTDAEGAYHFDIDLIYLNSEQLICRATLPNIAIDDRLQISDFGINIPSLVFPAPGRYEFRLRMEGHLIAQKDFSVMQMPTHQTA